MSNEIKPTITNALASYDITIPCERNTLESVLGFFRTHCKRWCFQQERGELNGFLHYQCRCSLRIKKRFNTMSTWIKNLLPGAHALPTSNPVFYTGDQFYVMKEETRINGPWSNKDDVNPADMPRRLRSELNWFPWQRAVLDIINKDPDDRIVNVIIDTFGNNGKSTFSMWLKAHKKAHRIPVQKDARDIMRLVMNQSKLSCYMIDLPRSTSSMAQNAIYGAIEEIKNGYAYDDRYHFQDELFEPPHVWIFTNVLPDQSLLSRDRWRFWTITHDKRLVPYSSITTCSLNIPIIPTQYLTLNIIR